ncbi:hypothetical protein Pla110_39770 [Polystyrenella longa]|uniref:Uncharacterized protein n=1 Tax=Polystyrenella longa TaxID=2528007 RepID=A0A518CSL5_9PLAN|nr:hypothetical protein Pla110_39770 [Polystyrenella longa]
MSISFIVKSDDIQIPLEQDGRILIPLLKIDLASYSDDVGVGIFDDWAIGG